MAEKIDLLKMEIKKYNDEQVHTYVLKSLRLWVMSSVSLYFRRFGLSIILRKSKKNYD